MGTLMAYGGRLIRNILVFKNETSFWSGVSTKYGSFLRHPLGDNFWVTFYTLRN